MAPRELPLILALAGAIPVGVSSQALPLLRHSRAQGVCMHHRPSEGMPAPVILRSGYGWGYEMSRVSLCLPPSTASGEEEGHLWRRETWGNARDERVPLALSAGVQALLVTWAARSLRRRHRELVAKLGVDIPLETHDGYRAPVKVKRALCDKDQGLWNHHMKRAAVAWLVSTLVVAWSGSGQAMLPMPWAIALWSALTLPGAVTHVHWRGAASWGLWMPVLGAVAMVVGGAWACAWVAAVSGVCSLCAWAQERRKRRDGSW